jgi:protein BCP1
MAWFKTIVNEKDASDWSKALTALLVEKCKNAAIKSKVSASLISQSGKSENRIGWLIHERFINMPPAIAPPMFRLLLEELDASNVAVGPVSIASELMGIAIV